MTELSEMLEVLKGIQAELQQANKTLSFIASKPAAAGEAAPRTAPRGPGRPSAGRPSGRPSAGRPAYGKPAGSSRGTYRSESSDSAGAPDKEGFRFPPKKSGYPKSGKPGPKSGPKKGGFRPSK